MWKLVVFRTTLALGLLALDRFTHIDELGFLAFLMGMKIYNSHGNRFIYLSPLQDFGKAYFVNRRSGIDSWCHLTIQDNSQVLPSIHSFASRLHFLYGHLFSTIFRR